MKLLSIPSLAFAMVTAFSIQNDSGNTSVDGFPVGLTPSITMARRAQPASIAVSFRASPSALRATESAAAAAVSDNLGSGDVHTSSILLDIWDDAQAIVQAIQLTPTPNTESNAVSIYLGNPDNRQKVETLATESYEFAAVIMEVKLEYAPFSFEHIRLNQIGGDLNQASQELSSILAASEYSRLIGTLQDIIYDLTRYFIVTDSRNVPEPTN